MKRFKAFMIFGAAILLTILAAEMRSGYVVTVFENAKSDYGFCEEHLYPDRYIMVNEATCSSKGIKYRECSVCGHKDIVEIPRNPDVHSQPSSFWMYDPEPTCAAGGVQFHICYACDGRSDVTELPPDPDKHIKNGDYVVITPATCSTQGEKAYQCKFCDTYFDRQPIEINAKSHVTDDTSTWKVTSFPTCAQEGSMDCYCNLCGKIAKTKSIPATGQHEPEDYYTTDKPATCVSDGLMSRHCSVCDAPSDEQVIPATPDVHTFTDIVAVDLAPTCTQEGVQSRHCLYCDTRTDIQLIPVNADNHAYNDEWIVTKAATCSEMGLMHQDCIRCGRSSLSTMIPKTAHTYGDYEVLRESADGMSAQVRYTCTVCGHENVTIITFGDQNHDNNVGDDPETKIFRILPVVNTFYKTDYETLMISNIAKNTTYAAFSENFSNIGSFVCYDKNGAFINEEDFVATGCRLRYDALDSQPTEYKLCVLGDTNGDGRVTAADARLILRAAAKLDTLQGAFFTAADVNFDGKITAADARKTLRVSSNLAYFETTQK